MSAKPDLSARWNELEPDLFGGRDHPILRAMRGTIVMVRINQIGDNDDLLSVDIMAGQLIRANRSEGLVLSLVGLRAGEELFLPLVPDAFTMLAPGAYQLSCGTIIRDPEFLGAFDLYSS